MYRGSILRSIAVVVLAFGLSGYSLGAAQDSSPHQQGISVIGRGQAHAPADTATLQIAVGELDYGGPTLPQPGVEAGARERDAVAPIVAALVVAGVPEEQIEVIVGPSIAELGTYFGPAMAMIWVVVDNPEQEQLGELVNTATTAAADERLVIGRTSAIFGIDDCSDLEREARELAVEDAYQQADIMAELLGVSRGDIVGASDLASDSQAAFGPYGPVLPGNECSSGDVALSPSAVSALPPFDPTAEPVVTAYAVLQLTFDLLDDVGATPDA